LVEQGRESLFVVDMRGQAIGMLSKTDYLRSLKADSFLQLPLRLISETLLQHILGWRRRWQSRLLLIGFLPPLLPRAHAVESPALVRSCINRSSNCASAGKM
jgi:hypothetical protein